MKHRRGPGPEAAPETATAPAAATSARPRPATHALEQAPALEQRVALKQGASTFLLAAILIAVLVAGCRPPFVAGSGDTLETAPPRVPTDTIQVRVEEGPTPPAQEPLRLQVLLRNPGTDTLHIEFPTAQRYDFRIRPADGETLWRWSDGRAFAQVLGRESIAPGDSLQWEATHGEGLAEGRYVVVGWITARDRQLRDSVVVRVGSSVD